MCWAGNTDQPKGGEHRGSEGRRTRSDLLCVSGRGRLPYSTHLGSEDSAPAPHSSVLYYLITQYSNELYSSIPQYPTVQYPII